jgi:putative phage-type endonuclease
MNAVLKMDRAKGLGASDAAAAIGLSKWKTPFRLWQEKTGQLPPEAANEDRVIDEALHLEMGKVLEPVALARFTRKTGYTVRDQQLQVVDVEHPWRWVTLDGIASDEGVVEAKSVGWANPIDWGDELEDDAIPLGYLIQVQHALDITKRPHAWVPLIVLNREFRVYRVNRDEELIQLVKAKEIEFWQHVQNRTPPPPISYEDASDQWPKDSGKTILASAEALADVTTLAAAKATLKTAEWDVECAKAKVAKFMGENQILVDAAGKKLVTWKTAKPSMKVDLDRMWREIPETVRKYEIEVAGSRRLLVK